MSGSLEYSSRNRYDNYDQHSSDDYNDTGSSQFAHRTLQQSWMDKYDWSWRLAISVVLSFVIMLILFFAGNTHFTEVRDVASIFNTTGRIHQVLLTTENFQR